MTERTDAGLELLQITLVVADLAPTACLRRVLCVSSRFRDPERRSLGSREHRAADGRTTFIEILSPKRPDTPGGRHLERQGGDGGYMVILQTRDLAPWRERIERLGLRIAFEAETQDAEDGQDWSGIHLHPSDTGGMMISLDLPESAGFLGRRGTRIGATSSVRTWSTVCSRSSCGVRIPSGWRRAGAKCSAPSREPAAVRSRSTGRHRFRATPRTESSRDSPRSELHASRSRAGRGASRARWRALRVGLASAKRDRTAATRGRRRSSLVRCRRHW